MINYVNNYHKLSHLSHEICEKTNCSINRTVCSVIYTKTTIGTNIVHTNIVHTNYKKLRVQIL